MGACQAPTTLSAHMFSASLQSLKDRGFILFPPQECNLCAGIRILLLTGAGCRVELVWELRTSLFWFLKIFFGKRLIQWCSWVPQKLIGGPLGVISDKIPWKTACWLLPAYPCNVQILCVWCSEKRPWFAQGDSEAQCSHGPRALLVSCTLSNARCCFSGQISAEGIPWR